MAISLAFHILFAVAGMAMPLLMALAEWRHQRTGDPALRELAKRWAKGTAILFAVGAVSGTALSFELGLLWPEFMRHAGPLVGMPFSLEGFAFFLEAIFLGLYLYGWDKLSPRVHLLTGVGVALCGLTSAVFVTAVNAWMNNPVGYSVRGGQLVDIEPWAVMRNPTFLYEAVHVALSAYVAVPLAVLGIHAWGLLRAPDSAFHRHAFTLALAVATVATPAQMLSGHQSAEYLARAQPIKLAAAEGLYETRTHAPLAIGGYYDAARDELRYAIELPSGLSLLVHMDPAGVVQGLEEVPPEDRPPVNVVHYAFDLMVLCGVAALAYVGLGALLWLRRKPPWARRWFLRLGLAVAPLGLVAIEAGWTVTEVGRQPWIIHGFMRTADSVTPMPGLVSPLIVFTLLYVVLGVVVVALLRNHVLAATTTARADDDADPRALVTSGEREPGDSLRAALARDLHEEGPR
ncbi:MAG: cytochrome ubiquinol oxidase subunit I [Myxococcales bacterium]|nr:cytochrome ubiquinol oxidase subunit I [Myxococcales bacterium]MCB9755608.1 cytochrome ubiquinol oxidase subunit I [Myxococcales bacterium]